MKHIFATASLFLLAASACSAQAVDECGMTGEWYSFRWAHNNSGHVRWKENGQHQGANFTDNEPVTFSSDGNITGGRNDGIPMGGGITATSWQCQGTDRAIIVGDMLGIKKRIKVHPDGYWEFYGGGFATYFVKADGGIEKAAERLLDYMELRAKSQEREFSRD